MNRNTPPEECLAKSGDVARYLCTTPNQLSRLRFEKKGPPYIKLGRSVRYRWVDVYRWVDDNVQIAGRAR